MVPSINGNSLVLPESGWVSVKALFDMGSLLCTSIVRWPKKRVFKNRCLARCLQRVAGSARGNLLALRRWRPRLAPLRAG